MWGIYMVQVVSESLHIIEDEIYRWREILSVPYQQYLQDIQGMGVTLQILDQPYISKE